MTTDADYLLSQLLTCRRAVADYAYADSKANDPDREWHRLAETLAAYCHRAEQLQRGAAAKGGESRD